MYLPFVRSSDCVVRTEYQDPRCGEKRCVTENHDIDEDHVKRPVLCEKGRASGGGTAGVYRLNWRRTSVFMFIALAFQVAILGRFQVQAQIPDGTPSGGGTSSPGRPAPNPRLITNNGTRSDTTPLTLN